MIWFLDDTARLNLERQEIDNLLAETDWLNDVNWTFINGRIGLTATIDVNGRLFPIRLIYPNLFPATPPSIYPQDQDKSWSEHQYGAGGELCLEWGPDNWYEEITGATMLRSAYKLLSSEAGSEDQEAREEVPSRHSLTLGQELRTKPLRFVCDDSTSAYLSSLAPRMIADINMWLTTHMESITAYLNEITLPNGDTWINPVIPSSLKEIAFEKEGLYISTSMSEENIRALSYEGLLDLLEDWKSGEKDFENRSIKTVLFSSESKKLHLFLISDKHNLLKFQTVRVDSGYPVGRIDPAFSRLSNKSAGIVGLGSSGSKIALSLARTGLRNFFLVDHDVFFPENICRHELTWEDVAQHKVNAIEHRLGLISEEINVSASKLLLSGQEASASIDNTLNKLGGCDVIVDATANPDVFNLLSTVAARYKTPLIWLEIFGGGIGGFIGRYRPEIEPDPKIMRLHLLGYLDKQDKEFPKTNSNYAAVTGQDEPIIATDSDVAIISAHATQMALDILLENEPSAFPYPMYLVGLKRGWVFNEPFYTIPLNMEDAQINTTEKEFSSSEEQEEALSFLKELLEKQSDDDHSAS